MFHPRTCHSAQFRVKDLHAREIRRHGVMRHVTCAVSSGKLQMDSLLIDMLAELRHRAPVLCMLPAEEDAYRDAERRFPAQNNGIWYSRVPELFVHPVKSSAWTLRVAFSAVFRRSRIQGIACEGYEMESRPLCASATGPAAVLDLFSLV